jgi:hypothetical protein
LQRELIALGAIDRFTSLFSFPGSCKVGFLNVTHQRCNEYIDRFCDYFEMPLDEMGRRFYLRHHQMRRFFALLFFWGNSQSGLETLRWFLGHTDSEQLYRYITESTPGEVMIGVKLDYVLEQLHRHDSSADGLAKLLSKRLNVDSIDVLDEAELEDHLEDLIRKSTVKVEPEFFTTHSGREYRILIIVSEGAE